MALILGFIKSNWKGLLVGVLVLILVLYVDGLRVEIAKQETKITNLTADNATLASNNNKLESSIAAANFALIETNKAALKANSNMTALGGTIKQQTADLKQHIDQILADKTPANCGDTITYLINAAPEYPK